MQKYILLLMMISRQNLIRINPLAWQENEANIRKKTVEQFPYAIYYEIQDERIYIYAIAAAKMKPGYWLKRVK